MPSYLAVVSSLLALASVGSALAVTKPRDTCSDPAVRKEWRGLTETEQLSYIDAVLCLQSAPAQTTDLYSVQSRYDDYVALHIDITQSIHWVGSFMPWHRYFIWLYEQDLANTCGYTGTLPYWDWTIEAAAPDLATLLESPMFDATYGFGGNGADDGVAGTFPGTEGGGCIQDGPFVNYTVTFEVGASLEYSPHCLARDMSAILLGITNSAEHLNWTLAAETFDEFEFRTEGDLSDSSLTAISVHGGGHLSMGGDMEDKWSSPSDPLFFLHHASIDRMWNNWQRQDWETRQSAIGGANVTGAYPFSTAAAGTVYSNVTLDFELVFGEIADSLTIAEVMDIESTAFCYTYA